MEVNDNAEFVSWRKTIYTYTVYSVWNMYVYH